MYRIAIIIFSLIVIPVSLSAQDTSVNFPTAEKTKPKVMVIIPEFHLIARRPPPSRRPRTTNEEPQITNRSVPDPAGETELINILLAKGFKVVDPSQVSKIRYNDQVRTAIGGNVNLAAKIGLEHGADVIIIGEAFSESAGFVVGDLMSSRARVEARAIRTDTGEILVADGKQASALDITDVIAGKKALKQASNELSRIFIEQLLLKWNNGDAKLTSVDLLITGLNFRQFVRFKAILLESVSEIKTFQQKNFTNGRAKVEIEITGRTQNLSEELIAKDFKEFNIEITDVSANRLAVLVKVKE